MLLTSILHITTQSTVSTKQETVTINHNTRRPTLAKQHSVLVGTLTVHALHPPIPRAFKGKFHILFSHIRQLHLTSHLLGASAPRYDIYFVDQLSTCVPLLRDFGHTRVVFYCHFPDKLLADGAYVEGKIQRKGGILKRIYRFPMDWLEELTTRMRHQHLYSNKS